MLIKESHVDVPVGANGTMRNSHSHLISSTHDTRLICDQVSLSFILLFLDTPMRKLCTVTMVYFILIIHPDDSLE